MISNPKFYKKITKATSELVDSLTDFEQGSENYEACLEYALQKFQNHRFLDVNSNKVNQRLQGLCEKFSIHSQPKKADILNDLKKSFLLSTITDIPGSSTELHYSLLSVLLNLSANPVNREYVKPIPKDKPVEEQFDWGRYLLEGEELFHPTQWAWDDTPCSSEDEGEPSPQKAVLIADRDDKQPHANRGLPPILKDVEKDLVVPYWKHDNAASDSLLVSGSHTSIEIPVACAMNEVNIIKEIMWLLAGQNDLFVFPMKDGRHVVSERVLLSHASTLALKSSLEHIAKHGDIIHGLRAFVYDHSHPRCQTYQAFAESLLKYLRAFQRELIVMERHVTEMEKTLTLGDFFKLLSSKLRELSTLEEVMRSSIKQDTDQETWVKKATRLLGELFCSILDLGHTSEHPSTNIDPNNCLLSIWMDSIMPYINIIDNWLSSGSLIDPFSEFVLQRSTSCPEAISNRFWYEGFSLASEDCVDSLAWLKPVINEIAVAGKSVEVLKSLGRSLDKRERTTLHSLFVDSICSHAERPKAKLASSALVVTCDSLLHLSFEKFFAEAPAPDFEPKVSKEITLKSQTPLPVLIQKSMHGLIHSKCQVASKSILKVFMEEHHLVSTLEIFQQFHLMGWGDVMYDFTTAMFRKMSAGEYWGDLMSLRATLQEAIAESRPEADSLAVTPAINRAKQEHQGANQLIHATDVVEMLVGVSWPLSIIITEDSLEAYASLFSYLLQVKRALFCLESLDFGKIYPEKPRHRNQTLGLQELSDAQKSHRLSLLRSKILRLVSHWHNFIMTSAIQAEKESFMNRLRGANDLNAVIAAHNSFLDRMCTICLLKQEKQADKMIQGTLQKIFNLCVVLHTKWNRGIASISSESIKKHEGEYKECSEFLGIILQNLVSRGAVPLSLESLAFCLMS